MSDPTQPPVHRLCAMTTSFWLAVGRGQLWKTIGAVLLAALYVGGLGQLSIFGNPTIVLFLVPPIALLVFGLALIHRNGLTIALIPDDARRISRVARSDRSGSASTSASAVEGLQFSIRHLLGCTALVAVLLTVGRGIRAFAGETGFVWGSGFVVPAIVVLSFVILLWTSVWATLGMSRPTVRLFVVFMVTILVGLMQPCWLAPSLRRADIAKFIPLAAAILDPIAVFQRENAEVSFCASDCAPGTIDCREGRRGLLRFYYRRAARINGTRASG